MGDVYVLRGVPRPKKIGGVKRVGGKMQLHVQHRHIIMKQQPYRMALEGNSEQNTNC